MRKIKKSKSRTHRNKRRSAAQLLRAKIVATAIVCFVIAGSFYALTRSRDLVTNASTKVDDPALCDARIGSASAAHHAQPLSRTKTEELDESESQPPVIATTSAPAPAPEGMVWIPSGEFSMGAEEPSMQDARPYHRVALDGFWMDQTEVTNEAFANFVKATGYVTVAERPIDAKDFPGAPPENLVPGSVVFTPPKTAVPLSDHLVWWSYVPGTNWRHPDGPASTINGKEKYPVVQIAFEDAAAYAKWAGKRLPTEAEFEFAARGGLDRKRFVWGDEFKPDGKFQANSFQGHFPDTNTGEDGFTGSAPVGRFAPNGFGLFDMAGNVWEWTSDWYRADYYQTLATTKQITRNPQGPSESLDPQEPETKKRVQKGGSFLCTDEYCARYMPGGRGKGDPDTGTNHLGFRCVRSR